MAYLSIAQMGKALIASASIVFRVDPVWDVGRNVG
jgi:hypothetical protein